MHDLLIQKIIDRLYGLKIQYTDGDDYITLEDVTDISWFHKLDNVLNNLKKYKYKLGLKLDAYLNNNLNIKGIDDIIHVSNIKSMIVFEVLLYYIDKFSNDDIMYFININGLDKEACETLLAKSNIQGRVKLV